jgi:hypothetical protein
MKMKKFIIHWNNKTTTDVEGYDIADAFRRAGFGGGILRAVDYWEEIKTTKTTKVST